MLTLHGIREWLRGLSMGELRAIAAEVGVKTDYHIYTDERWNIAEGVYQGMLFSDKTMEKTITAYERYHSS